MTDNDIIDLFFARSEEAINELAKKYGHLCIKISYNILGNVEDSEECVNDAYFSVWNLIPPQRPSKLCAFLLKIVRNISLNRYDYNSRKKRNNTYTENIDELAWCISSSDMLEDELDNKVIVSAVNEFLKTLDDTSQMLFVRRYWYMDSYEELSEVTGLKSGTIRTKLSRICIKLRLFLKERDLIN